MVAGALWLRTSLPRTDERVRVNGLSAPVEVLRDKHGIPHIFASTSEDAAFGIGYVHAQDRLWQMESMRRMGAGRLAEVVGSPAIKSDRFMRTLGLYRLAEQQYASLSQDVQQALDAYAAGVNAWLFNHKGPLPPEFFVLGFEPEPWRPADSLVWIKIMALRLATNRRTEMLRARLSNFLTPQQVNELWPPYLDSDPIVIEDPGKAHSLKFDEILTKEPDWQRLPRSASNVWAVAGERTTTGKPLLANDPHLGLSAPVLWYLLSLETPDMELSGASSPGFPFPILGHNHRIAWGMSATGSDIEDLFVERVDPENPQRYLTPDGPRLFETRVETIGVKDADDIALTVRVTRHGPVISDLVEQVTEIFNSKEGDANDEGAFGDRVLALAATYLQDEDRTPEAAFRLSKSESWRQFVDALESFHAPQLNFIYADVDGNIGFIAPGRVPLRHSGRGAIPKPGWDGEADWMGFVPFDALPRSYNPSAGRLINANNKIGPKQYPWYLGDSWDAGYRARRIAELLSGRDLHSPDTISAMQMDIVSRMAQHLLPMMLEVLPNQKQLHRVTQILRAWSGDMSRHRPEPLIFVAWLRAFNRAVYADELGDLWQLYWGYRPRFIASVLEENSTWCDNINTGTQEDCAKQLEVSLENAITELSNEFGEDPEKWRWGSLHTAQFSHLLFTHVPVLKKIADLEIETDGGFYTINRGANLLWDPTRAFAHVHGAGFRAVYDLSNLSQSRFIIATGQSGNPLSEHYRDMVKVWRDGGWIRLGQTREALKSMAAGRLMLKPRSHDPSEVCRTVYQNTIEINSLRQGWHNCRDTVTVGHRSRTSEGGLPALSK